MKIVKYLIGAAMITTFAVGAIAFVGAQTPSPTPTVSPTPQLRPPKMVIQINPSGNALVRGTVDQVGTASLTLKSWGGDWTVNVSDSTKYFPGAALADIKVGDWVGIQGKIDQNSSWTVDATVVHDWSSVSTIKNSEKEIKNIEHGSKSRNWQGTASDVNASGNSLTLTIKGTAYTVNVASSAKVVNKSFLPLALSGVSNGDTVRVFGSVSGTTITASVLRDISVK